MGERTRLCDVRLSLWKAEVSGQKSEVSQSPSLLVSSLEQRLDHGLEVGIQLFGCCLHFVFA